MSGNVNTPSSCTTFMSIFSMVEFPKRALNFNYSIHIHNFSVRGYFTRITSNNASSTKMPVIRAARVLPCPLPLSSSPSPNPTPRRLGGAGRNDREGRCQLTLSRPCRARGRVARGRRRALPRWQAGRNGRASHLTGILVEEALVGAKCAHHSATHAALYIILYTARHC